MIDELFEQQLASDREYAAHDEERDWPERNPPPTFVNQIIERGPEVIPAVIEVVERADAHLHRALDVLRGLTVPMPADVIDRLANLAPFDSQIARALFRFDPARAYALDLHRSVHWPSLFEEATDKAQHVARMLEDPEHPVVPWVLGKPSSGLLSGTPLSRIPTDLVPIDLLRVLARSTNADIRAPAIHHLAWIHDPEDAYLVLAHAVQTSTLLEGSRSHDVRWLAPLNGSERLRVQDDQVFELVRRRRCAGLTTDESERARELVAKKPREDDTARLVIELGNMELAETLLAIPKLDYRDSHLRDCLQGKRTWWMSIAWAEEMSEKGRVDDCTLVDSTAYAAYAYTLLHEPTNAHAALQIAWIDRAWGTPITPRRIEWLRELGVRDESLLEELAIPVPPVVGMRRMEEFSKPHYAQMYERACLWACAAFHCRTLPEEKARLEALAAAHIDRVVRATGIAAGPRGL